MKNSLITLCLVAVLAAYGQTTTSSKSTVSVSTDDINSRSSITRSKGSYEFDASFDKDKYEAVRDLLVDDLGTDNLEVKGKTYHWSRKKGDREFFTCKLETRELQLSLNTEVASYAFEDQIDALGDDLRDLIQKHEKMAWMKPTPPTPPTPPQNPNSQDPQLVRDELKQAEMELERARRRVERLKKKQN